MRIKITSLFSGIGAFEQALTNIGVEYEVVNFCEIDKYAIKSYCGLHGIEESLNLGDISKVEKLQDCDLLTYGFPCQSISVSGKMEGLTKGSGTRSGLLWEVERLLENSSKPKYLIMENVKNLVGKQFKDDFDKWLIRLEELGYNNYWRVLNSKNYGVPQNRERVFCISIRKDIDLVGYEFSQSKELKIKLKDILEDNVDKKYYLSDKIQQRFQFKPQGENVIGTTAPDFRAIGQRGLVYDTDKIMGALVATDYKQPKQIIEMDVTRLPVVCEQRCDEGLRFFKDDICGTLRTIDSCGDKRVIMDNFKIRKLMPIECWKLQGFTKEQFNRVKSLGMSDSQLYKQAGNSITVNVLEDIFKNLLK